MHEHSAALDPGARRCDTRRRHGASGGLPGQPPVTDLVVECVYGVSGSFLATTRKDLDTAHRAGRYRSAAMPSL